MEEKIEVKPKNKLSFFNKVKQKLTKYKDVETVKVIPENIENDLFTENSE